MVFLDQPSCALDAAAKCDMWLMLRSVTPGRAILMTTHSLEEADELGQHCIQEENYETEEAKKSKTKKSKRK